MLCSIQKQGTRKNGRTAEKFKNRIHPHPVREGERTRQSRMLYWPADIPCNQKKKEAPDSGVLNWRPEKKKRFANHLIAVHSGANREIGAGDPVEWLPTHLAFRETYAQAWVQIKVQWVLSADCEELLVLKQILEGEDFVFPEEEPEYVCIQDPFSAQPSISGTLSGEVVKKSGSGICHDRSGPWYSKTKRFMAFDSLQKCLANGGDCRNSHSIAFS